MKFLLAFVLISILLIAGCTKNTNTGINPIKYDLTFSSSDCSKIENIGPRDGCYYEVSKKTLNESDCNQIVDSPDIKKFCQAIVNKNVSLCEGDYTGLFCTPFVAILSNNASLCEGYGSCEECQQACLAIFDSNIEECDKLSGFLDKVDCYMQVAISTGDERICGSIANIPAYSSEDKKTLSGVKNGCFNTIALERKNQTICDNIEISSEFYDIDKKTMDECLTTSK
jgi:hypothetical protein